MENGPVRSGTTARIDAPYERLQRALRTQDEDQDDEPIAPVSIDIHESAVIVGIDGRVYHDAKLVFKRAHVERMRAGYACVVCWEKFREAYPERCHACGFEVRKRQDEEFARRFEGEEWVGSRIDLNEERARLADWSKRQVHNPNATIYIPDWVKL